MSNPLPTPGKPTVAKAIVAGVLAGLAAGLTFLVKSADDSHLTLSEWLYAALALASTATATYAATWATPYQRKAVTNRRATPHRRKKSVEDLPDL